MKLRALLVILAALGAAACGGAANTSTNANSAAKPEEVTAMGRPKKIEDMMKARGEQDLAEPTLKILEPKEGATVTSSTVSVKLELGGNLKGYMPGMNEETHTGNHIHVILDNQPYEAYYNIGQPFELRNLADGLHTIRVFPSRPWHESYKNDGAFQMVSFIVKNGGADKSKPATVNGSTVADATPAPTPEGKDMPDTKGGSVDPKKPLLTYSRPKGEYKGEDGKMVMLDYWVLNTDLTFGPPRPAVDPCPCKVRYAVDGKDMGTLNAWGPIWLSGLAPGKHKIKLELVDRAGKVIENGGYNSTEREITITP